MKKLNSSKVVLIATVVLSFFLTSFKNLSLGPVCPFPVTNNMGCQVTITWEVFNNGVSCGAPSSQVIQAGAVYNIPCAVFSGCGTGPYDVAIAIIDIDSSLDPVPNPQAVRSTSSGPKYFGPCSGDPNIPTGCYSGKNENIVWTSSGVTIY